jgi:hypothetical protein
VGAEVKQHSLLNSVRDKGEWSYHAPATSAPRKSPRCPMEAWWAYVDDLEESKMSCTCGESNPGSTCLQPSITTITGTPFLRKTTENRTPHQAACSLALQRLYRHSIPQKNSGESNPGSTCLLPSITTITGTLFLRKTTENRTPDQAAYSLALQRLPVLCSSEKNTSRCAQGNKLAQSNSTWRIFVNTNDKLSSDSLVREISTTNHRRLKEWPEGVSSGCLIR